MYEPLIRVPAMNPQERRHLVQKAKADRLAFEAAELLSRGDMAKAATLAGECRTLAGLEQSEHWLRHYATTKFRMARGTVDEFLSSMPPANVAV
jgi:hypothetical protein